MKLAIAQILLEKSQFGHRGDFLSVPPGTPVPASESALNVEIVRNNDFSGALVRLVVAQPEGAGPYDFSASYVVLINMEPEAGEAIPADIDRRLMITGASMAFPFIRELVANLTSRGRFGPIWLAPTDFNKVIVANAPAPLAVPAG